MANQIQDNFEHSVGNMVKMKSNTREMILRKFHYQDRLKYRS